MPNPFQATPLSKRAAVDTWEMRKQDNQEKLDVNAKPIDAYVAPVKEATDIQKDPTLTALSGFFDEVQKMPGVYVNMAESSKTKNEAKAIADQKAGKYDNPADAQGLWDKFLNPGAGYDAKWNTLHGEAKMSEARIAATTELTANSFFINDPDRDKKVQSVIDKHYQSAGLDSNNVYQMAGAAHEYQALKEDALKGVNATYWEKKTTDHVNDVGSRIGTLISQYRQKVAKEGGKYNPIEARQLFGSVRDVIDPNLVPPEKQSQVIVNAILSDTKKQVEHLTSIGELDEAEALKDDVMLTLRTPDASGYNWANVLDKNGKRINGESIDAYDDHLTAHIDKAEQKLEIKNDKVYAENTDLFMEQLFRLKDRNDVENFINVIDTADNEGYLNNDGKTKLVEMRNRFLQGDLYVIESPSKVTGLMVNVYMGKVKKSEIYKAVDNGEIRRDTAEKAINIIDRLKAHQDALAAEGRQKEYHTWQTLYSQQHTDLIRRYGDKTDPAVVEAAESHFNDLVFTQKLSPSKAYQETIRAYPDGTVNSIYKNVEEADKAFLDATKKFRANKMTKKDYDNVVKNYTPWSFAGNYYASMSQHKPDIKK